MTSLILQYNEELQRETARVNDALTPVLSINLPKPLISIISEYVPDLEKITSKLELRSIFFKITAPISRCQLLVNNCLVLFEKMQNAQNEDERLEASSEMLGKATEIENTCALINSNKDRLSLVWQTYIQFGNPDPNLNRQYESTQRNIKALTFTN